METLELRLIQKLDFSLTHHNLKRFLIASNVGKKVAQCRERKWIKKNSFKFEAGDSLTENYPGTAWMGGTKGQTEPTLGIKLKKNY